MSNIIIELDGSELDLLASMVHTMLRQNPEHIVAKRLLESLRFQTDTVSDDGRKHGVTLGSPHIADTENVKLFLAGLNEEQQ